MELIEPLTVEHLPALNPDLVVVGNGQSWRVERCSLWLAQQLGVPSDSIQGRDVQALFSGSQPQLIDLFSEVIERDAVLSGILFRLPDGETHVSINLEPLGLSENYTNYRIALFLRAAPQAPSHEPTFGLVGASPALKEVLRKVDRYGPTDAAVVVTGETGTGKELVAAALHAASKRVGKPFVALNCSAMSTELLESELFGHEKGAFTGALRSHLGRFQRADGGTLFLDEIGDMPLHTQTRLLRVLETGLVERVGAEQEQPVDVRVVAATNVLLEQAVGAGRFRADLYHRLSVLRIHLPPLRERREDIAPLVQFFLGRLNDKYGKHISRLTSEAEALLQSYLWPGNVRELRNVLERVYIETESEVISARSFAEWIRERQDFSPGEWGHAQPAPRPIAPPVRLASEQRLLTSAHSEALAVPPVSSSFRHTTRPVDLDAEQIRAAYRATDGNLSAAARLLGIHRATLYRYLHKLDLNRTDLGN